MGLTPVGSVDEAIELANQTNYGLSAAIFTENLDNAMRFAREVDSGNLHINWGSQWSADLMPYGGLKDSGFGKEGPKYAVQEMTETNMVVMHLPSRDRGRNPSARVLGSLQERFETAVAQGSRGPEAFRCTTRHG